MVQRDRIRQVCNEDLEGGEEIVRGGKRCVCDETDRMAMVRESVNGGCGMSDIVKKEWE